MSLLSGDASGRESITALYTSGCNALADDSLIILDDLQTTGRDGLSDRLIILARACAASGVKLFTTSGNALPRALEGRCEHFRQEVTPPFNPVEIKEFLGLHGCPERGLTGAHVHAIHLFSRGHPVLLAAIARILEDHRWQFDAAFLDLVNGKLGLDLNKPVQDWLLETVTDHLARDLLYRIRMIGGPFSEGDVIAIAGVRPEISTPIEKLRRLTGLWIQHDTQSVYIASPLVQSLPGGNLNQQTTRGVHLSIAKEVVRKRKLGPFDIMQAFLHLGAAGQFNEAAFVLLIAMQSIASAPDEMPEDFGLAAIWAEQELPQQIDLSVRLFLRSCQTVVRLRRGQDASFLLRDFDRLTDHAEAKDGLAVLGASGLLVMWLGKSEPVRAAQYVVRAMAILRNTSVPAGLFPDTGPRGSYLLMLWLVAMSINLPSGLAGWLNALRALTPSERQDLFALEISAKVSEIVATGIWLREGERLEIERDWNRLIRELGEIGATARELGAYRLYLQAQRAIILITSQFINDIHGAIRLAVAVLHSCGGKQEAEFLIAEVVARQLYFRGEIPESLAWWDRALAARSAAELEPLVSALTVSGAAYVESDGNRALAALRDAAQLAIGLPQSAWITAVRAEGEFAILLWHRQEFRACFEAWARAARLLIANKDDSLDWKILFRLIGACSTYFGRSFRQEDPHGKYVVPTSGILLLRPEAVASSYHAAQEWLLPASIGMFAWSAGANLDASEWARRAVAVAESLGQDDRLFRGLRPTLFIHQLPALLKEGSAVALVDSIIELKPGAPPTDEIPIVGEDAERELEIISRLSRMSADVATFAVGISVLQRALDDLSTAILYANAIVNRSLAISDLPGDFWPGFSRVFSDMFRSDHTWKSLYEIGKLHAMSKRSLLGALYYFSSMRVSDHPVTALRLQLAVLPSVEGTFGGMPVPYKDIYSMVVPGFVTKFWLKLLEIQPFYFGQIRFLRGKLDSLSKIEPPSSHDMKSVVRAVAGSLGAELANEDRNWLLG
jgi:hypothetical protein